jgi:diaminopimelate epimerase
MEFSKYEATGNDFIMVDGLSSRPPELSPEEIGRLCDRHTGVGADGVIFLLPSETADARMRIFNVDGSEAEMCGNGLRALALFMEERGLIEGPAKEGALSVETAAGARQVTGAGAGKAGRLFTVDMGTPAYTRASVPMSGPPDEAAIGVTVHIDESLDMVATCVSMGNPHCVFFIDDIYDFPVETVGPAVEANELFPSKTNVEFVRVVDASRLAARVWERGVGETMACGTGACAAAVAARLNGLAGDLVTVWLAGGELEVKWDGNLLMTGPARRVFDGRTAD